MIIKNSLISSIGILFLLTLSACGGSSSNFGGTTNTDGGSTNNKHSITGRVTQLDRLTVNGVEYNISNAQLTRNNTSVTDTSLFQLGEIITLQTTGNTINTVTHQSQIRGPISLAPLGDSFEAVGQIVRTDSTTVFHGFSSLLELTVNTMVEISGFIDRDSDLRATSIRLSDSSIHVEGIIKNLDNPNKTFDLNNLLVDFSDINQDIAVYTNGQSIIVEAQQYAVNNNLLASNIRVQESPITTISSNASHEQEGRITAINGANSFSINTLLVNINSETQFINGGQGSLGLNLLVLVKGSVIDNAFVASHITFY